MAQAADDAVGSVGSLKSTNFFCLILSHAAKYIVSWQKTGLATQLLKINDQYQCLVKLIESMKSAQCTIKEAMQVIQELDFGEETCSINCYIPKRMQKKDIFKITWGARGNE